MKTIPLLALSVTLTFMTLNPSGALAKAPPSKPIVISDAGGQGGNGAGGVTRGGKYMTFFSARVMVAPEELTLADIPNLEATISFINQSDVFSSKVKSRLIRVLVPSKGHTYYRVPKEFFTKEIQQRLREEYARISKQTIDQTELFAITDTSNNQTYLLPPFYELRKKEEQMAILMHEAEWIRHPDAKGSEIVKLEVAYQALFENPNDSNRGFAIATALEGYEGAMRFAILRDSRVGGPLVNGNTLQAGDNSLPLTALNLFGEPFAACVSVDREPSCSLSALPRLIQLYQAFPNSMLLRALYEKAANNQLHHSLLSERRPGYVDLVADSGTLVNNVFWDRKKCVDQAVNLPLVFVDSNPAVAWYTMAQSPEGIRILIK